MLIAASGPGTAACLDLCQEKAPFGQVFPPMSVTWLSITPRHFPHLLILQVIIRPASFGSSFVEQTCIPIIVFAAHSRVSRNISCFIQRDSRPQVEESPRCPLLRPQLRHPQAFRLTIRRTMDWIRTGMRRITENAVTAKIQRDVSTVVVSICGYAEL